VVLQRYDLTDAFDEIRSRHSAFSMKKAKVDDRRDLLFALAELSYLQGEQLKKSTAPDDAGLARDYFLLSSIYAYLYLLGDGKEPPPSAWDARFREACDLYNRASARVSGRRRRRLDGRELVRNLPRGS